MKGANRFCEAFKDTQQTGRLYLVVSSHARGPTFRIFVLPDGDSAMPNGSGNPPLNKDAVEVYGATSGQCGWDETYGWLHEGKWQDEFLTLYKEAEAKNNKDRENTTRQIDDKKKAESNKRDALLATYT